MGAGDGQTFDSFNPTTGEVWAKIPSATEGDVNRAVEVERAPEGGQ
ncbi:MAG: hypothetical protein AB7I79_22235 [Rhizobiaceae bacterium]